jgi:cystathionine beta-lyase/cystathionine gamma-synthase
MLALIWGVCGRRGNFATACGCSCWRQLGVEFLVVLPAYTSHYNMSLEELAKAHVTPGTVPVSIGIEDTEDLIEDLRQALR